MAMIEDVDKRFGKDHGQNKAGHRSVFVSRENRYVGEMGRKERGKKRTRAA